MYCKCSWAFLRSPGTTQLRGEGVAVEGHPETRGQEAHSSERKSPPQRCCREGIPSRAEEFRSRIAGTNAGCGGMNLGVAVSALGSGQQEAKQIFLRGAEFLRAEISRVRIVGIWSPELGELWDWWIFSPPFLFTRTMRQLWLRCLHC